jgi:hypothetical protein
MLPSRGVRVWVVYLTPIIERVISLLSASPVGEARCRCRKVWLTRIDYYYYYYVAITHWLVSLPVVTPDSRVNPYRLNFKLS